MIRINLIPAGEAARAADRRRDLTVGAAALALLVFVFGAAHLRQFVELRLAERQRVRLTAEREAIQGPYDQVAQMEKDRRELQEKLKVIAQLEARKVGPVRILAELAGATPEKLWLTEYSDTSGTLKLTGLGVDENTVADFMRRLGALTFFHGVDLDETSQVVQDGAKLKKFIIHTQIDYGAAMPQSREAAATGGKP